MSSFLIERLYIFKINLIYVFNIKRLTTIKPTYYYNLDCEIKLMLQYTYVQFVTGGYCSLCIYFLTAEGSLTF